LPPNAAAPKRIEAKKFNYQTALEEYVTSRSLQLFNVLCVNSEQDTRTFLAKHPSESDPIFQSMKAKVRLLKVVNDCAERGVALIQSYNAALKMRHKNNTCSS
jgi:uncharacterized protein YjaG (DUF416 family)